MRLPTLIMAAFGWPGLDAQVNTAEVGVFGSSKFGEAVWGAPKDSDSEVCPIPRRFPFDPTETADSDSDSVGDDADAFPNDPKALIRIQMAQVIMQMMTTMAMGLQMKLKLLREQSTKGDTDGDGVDDRTDVPVDAGSERSGFDGVGDNADLDDDADGLSVNELIPRYRTETT